MNLQEAGRFLTDSKVEIDLNDPSDAIEIGIRLGLLGLKHLTNEMSGSFDTADITALRRGGMVVRTIGFGQAVYEAVPIRELDK